MKKLLKKTKCKACGNKTMIGRKSENEVFQKVLNCPTCRSLGVGKAIEQRLMLTRKAYCGVFKIEDGKSQIRHENKIHQRVMIN